jgi:hypothetical protein
MNFTPLLADLDIKELFWLGVLVITGLSWLVKQLRGGDAPPVGPAGPRPAEKPLRSEIEIFLQELTKGQPDPKPQRPQPPPPQRRPPQPQKAKQEKPRKPQRPAPVPSAAPAKPGKRLEDQHLPASQLGQGVRSHVSTYMAPERVATEAERHLGHRVDEAVKQDLGVAGVQPVAATPGKHPLLELLSQRSGRRQAIILSEVLQKPVALRSRR